jgi:cold shock CspA family protein
MHEGTIISVKLDRGYGFVSSPGQPDTFFHSSDLSEGLAFDEQLLERRVKFDIYQSGKGLRAVNVQPAN